MPSRSMLILVCCCLAPAQLDGCDHSGACDRDRQRESGSSDTRSDCGPEPSGCVPCRGQGSGEARPGPAPGGALPRALTHDHFRFVDVPDPERGADRERNTEDYRASVAAWHDARAQRYAATITAELPHGGTVGFLIWGDPAIYDSTIRIVEAIRNLGIDLELSVIPGISSIQLLAARHKIILNRVGQPIHVTTGRRLLEEYSPALGNVVVMLDGDLACSGLVDRFGDLAIYWGAQLGLPDE